MTPESICTSLEWSKKLKEAGWQQDTLYYWFLTGGAGMKPKWVLITREQFHDGLVNERYAAPTAEEILRRLPRELDPMPGKGKYFLRSLPTHQGYDVYYENNQDEPFRLNGMILVHRFSDDSLANASAAMYCYLAENDLLPSNA